MHVSGVGDQHVGDAICRPKGWAGVVRSVRGRTSLVVVLDMPVCRRARYTNAMAVDPGRSTCAARVICGAPDRPDDIIPVVLEAQR